MLSKEAIKKLSSELETVLLNNSPEASISLNDIEQYIQMAYCVGYDEGTRSRSNRKAVYQLTELGTIIEEFQSAKQAFRSTKATSYTGIKDCCTGKLNTSGGYRWMYVEDYDKLKGNQ